MVLTMWRLVAVSVAAVCAWSTSGLYAQAPAADGGAQLEALMTEFTTRRGAAGGTLSVLPTIAQARADSAWAGGFLARLRRLDPDRLSHDDWITYAMLENDAAILEDAAEFFWFGVPITPYSSPLRGVAGAFGSLPLGTAADVDAYVDALHRVPVVMASYEAHLRSQMQRGIVAPAAELRLALPYVRGFAAPPDRSPFSPQAAQLASLPEELRAAASARIATAIAVTVIPAVDRLASFVDGPYRAKAPPAVGLAQYPNGRAYYEFLIRRHTSLALTPEEIHAIGVAEVERLERALDQVRRDANFAGTLAEFHAYLRTDRRFLASSSEDIGVRMMKAIARIEPVVDAYFPLKPAAPYGVKRLDPALEGSMTYGYYQMPTASERGGYYMFNGFKPEERSILMADATIYHELVPGHHFQIALQRENAALPPYRRTSAFTAFTEGWAEYASDLAGEMGMYADPYARAGRLAMDLFLSTRLVVDTGMNALGWPRERAVAYMREHTFESDLQIDTETLRYSADYHGQALAYKLGARTFHELRARAARVQGATFSLPAFHAWVLRAGSMPLTVLDAHADCFARERHAARGSR